VYVIAEESQLQNAIRKPSISRKTRLKQFLQNELSVSHASPADFPQSKSSGDSRGPSTQPPTSPIPTASANTVTNDVTKSKASLAKDGPFTFAAEWRMFSFDEVDEDEKEILAQSRGSKRTSDMNISESPSKVLMVGAMLIRVV
jgi:hypothetical protein